MFDHARDPDDRKYFHKTVDVNLKGENKIVIHIDGSPPIEVYVDEFRRIAYVRQLRGRKNSVITFNY